MCLEQNAPIAFSFQPNRLFSEVLLESKRSVCQYSIMLNLCELDDIGWLDDCRTKKWLRKIRFQNFQKKHSCLQEYSAEQRIFGAGIQQHQPPAPPPSAPRQRCGVLAKQNPPVITRVSTVKERGYRRRQRKKNKEPKNTKVNKMHRYILKSTSGSQKTLEKFLGISPDLPYPATSKIMWNKKSVISTATD